MDKVDVVLYRYKKENKKSKEFMNMVWIMITPMIILLSTYFLALFICPIEWVGLALLLCIVLMAMWIKVIEGKWGTKKWKNKWLKTYRDRFKSDQSKLIEIIIDEGLNGQQVYNLLIKKYNRIPQRTDNRTFVITIISLLIALTGVLASPLQNVYVENYVKYVTYVITILCLLVPVGCIIYKFVVSQSKMFDEKKNNYAHMMELLEDYLY